MQVTRRQFIRLGGASAGALALGSGLTTRWWGRDGSAVPDPGTEGERVVPTFCEMCFWRCGVLAHVREGRVTKLTGNPAHPLSRGRLCPRGSGGIGLLYDPDRLRRPLVRRSRRGAERFEEVSWDAALGRVAEAMTRLARRHGPEALALYTHGFGGSWFKHLLAAYGSANVAAPSYAQCRGPREAGFQLTFGSGVGSPECTDLENARCITLIGSHLGENMHNTQVQELAAALGRGAELVVVDPRYSTAAGKARHWLPIKPGTDVALLLAWMHVILAEKLHDREYLERHAVGLDRLEAHVRDRTPEWAFAQTSIPPEKIVETARFVAGARPASLVHPGRRVTWYGDDSQRSRAIAMLNALLGSWGRRGGFFQPARMAIPAYPYPENGRRPRDPADAPRGTVYPFADEVLASGVCDASIPGTAAYDVKGWIVYGTNLMQALPAPDKVAQAIQELELIVAVDVLPAEIVGWADVVLPECTYLERWDDLDAPPWKVPFVALRQPAVEPLPDSRPGWWIARELGRRLGLEAHFPWRDGAEVAMHRARAAGLDWDELRRTGAIVGAPEPIYFEDGLEPAFATPSGRIELRSERLAAAGLDPMPVHVPPEEPPPGSFRLLFGRSPVHTFGRTTNNRFLAEADSGNEVWMNAAAARELGLRDRERVVLVNQDGVRSQPLPLKATERIRPDCVYMVHGWGHEARGLRFARGRGASDSRLVTRVRVDPVMGGTGMNVNFVRVERAA